MFPRHGTLRLLRTRRGSAFLSTALGLLALLATPAGHAWSDPPKPGLVFETIEAVETRSEIGMVSANSSEAAAIAVEVLEAGGNAIDAAVAAGFALGSSDPSSAGLGGTAYILIRFPDGRTVAIDGSAVVPGLVNRARLVQLRAESIRTDPEMIQGFEWVAVPGTVAALDLAARRYGSRPWHELLAPAIRIAEDGYAVTLAKQAAIEKYLRVILATDLLRLWILRDGIEVPDIGERFCNPELARTLRTIAAGGADVFYRGEIARAIEEDMSRRGGFVRAADLARAGAREIEPLRTEYRGVEVVTFPPPGGGGVVVEALNILSNFTPDELHGERPDRVRLLAETFHVATEDGLGYWSAPAHLGLLGALPYQLTREHAAARAALVRKGRLLGPDDLRLAGPSGREPGGTTHLSIVDRHGTVVALSQTIGRFYGAKVMTGSLGFPYNSLLQACELEGPRRVKPWDRLATMMAPTMAFAGGDLVLAIGGSGSSKIPSTVALFLSDMLDRGLSVREAVEAPRIGWAVSYEGGELHLEVRPPVTKETVEDLEARGYTRFKLVEFPAERKNLTRLGAVAAVGFDPATRMYIGVSAPRRAGRAAGPRL
ncbi:MAG: gamma-glutamyltransferase [Acidobacteriota bacterium]